MFLAGNPVGGFGYVTGAGAHQHHFDRFGDDAASRLIAKVQALPLSANHALLALKLSLDRVSPTAYATATKYMREAQAAGNDPDAALHFGVAKALSESMVDQLHTLGSQQKSALAGLGLDPRFGAQAVVGQVAPTGRENTNQVSGLKVGPWTFGMDAPTTVQVHGNFDSPRWTDSDSNYPAGLVDSIPTDDGKGNNWQQIIADMLSHDCKFTGTSCFTSSMTSSAKSTRYGNLRDFIPNLPDQINKDYIGLVSGDGQGGDDANKAPDLPIIVTINPKTNEQWGVYMMLAVPFGGQAWDTPDNPCALLLKFKKIDDTDCASGITAENVAVVAAASFATGGLLPLFTSLGLISLCYLWQFVKVVVAEIVNIVEDVVDTVVGLACKLVSAPGLGQAVTTTGSQTKNAETTAIGVGIQAASALCGGACPTGQTIINGKCACPIPGQLLQNGKCSCQFGQVVIDGKCQTPWFLQWYTLAGAAALVGLAIFTKKPSTAAKAG